MARGDVLTNKLERVLVRARDSGDSLKLLRALARDVVCLAQPGPGPKPGRPEFRSMPLEQQQLPVAQGRDGRSYLLAFTSSAALFTYYDSPEQVWAQVGAGQLFDTLPAELPVFLNPGLATSVVLEPADVRTVAQLWRGVRVAAAITPGPATPLLLGDPVTEPVELLTAVCQEAARHPEVRSASRGLARLDEPEAVAFWLLGLRLNSVDRAVHAPVARAILAAIESATGDLVQVLLLPDRPRTETEAWLSRCEPFYVAP